MSEETKPDVVHNKTMAFGQDGDFMHISIVPRRVEEMGFDLEAAKKKIEAKDYTPEEWMDWAAMAHNVSYTFQPLSDEEASWVKEAYEVLYADGVVPKVYQEGVHGTKHTAWNCGEGIWIVDGTAQHDAWLQHKACNGKGRVLSRRPKNEGERGELWCTECSRTFPRSEIKEI